MDADSSQEWTTAQKAALVGRILTGELTVQQACERHSLLPEQIRDWVLLYRRSAREALDEQLLQVLVQQGMDAAALQVPEMSGSLEDIPVGDLLQTLALGRRDGFLTITHRGQQSRLWCSGGEIVDAESGRLTGAPAVYRVLALEQGQLQADLRSVQRVRVINDSMPALLLEAARRRDEGARLRARLGEPGQVYLPSVRALSSEAPEEPAMRQVLRLLNDGCTLDEVLAASDLGDLETLQVFSRLLDQRYVVAHELLTLGRLTAPPAEPSFDGPVSSLRAHIASAGPRPQRKRPLAVILGGLAAAIVLLARLFWPEEPHGAAPPAALASPAGTEPAGTEPPSLPSAGRAETTVSAPAAGSTHATPLAAPRVPAAAALDEPSGKTVTVRSPSAASAANPPRRIASRRVAPRRAPASSVGLQRPEPTPEPSSSSAPAPPPPFIRIIPDQKPNVQVIE